MPARSRAERTHALCGTRPLRKKTKKLSDPRRGSEKPSSLQNLLSPWAAAILLDVGLVFFCSSGRGVWPLTNGNQR